MTGALNRYRQLTLMARASAGYSAGQNLCSLRDKAAQFCDILVVDFFDFINAEGADLSSRSSVSAVTLVNHVFPSYQNGISSSKPMGEPKLSMPPWFWAFPLWEGVLP